jgi:hypothetical protein
MSTMRLLTYRAQYDKIHPSKASVGFHFTDCASGIHKMLSQRRPNNSARGSLRLGLLAMFVA